MKKVFLLLFGGVFLLSGCVARTYPLTKERVDQQLSEGNRGYLMGKATGQEKTRKETREIRVFEIEFGSPYKIKNKGVVTSGSTYEIPAAPEPSYMPEPIEPAPLKVGGTFKKYTVQKNDTLQKISQKFYGTTRKWMKIYNANRDTLATPDKLYPGKVIKIPEGKFESEVKIMKEPKENLK